MLTRGVHLGHDEEAEQKAQGPHDAAVVVTLESCKLDKKRVARLLGGLLTHWLVNRRCG